MRTIDLEIRPLRIALTAALGCAGCLGDAPTLPADLGETSGTHVGESSGIAPTTDAGGSTSTSTSDADTSAGSTAPLDTSTGDASSSTDTGASACVLAATWTTVDDLAGTMVAQARGVAGDASGSVYVAGNVDGRWSVRRSDDRGEHWETIDDYTPGGLLVAGAAAVAISDTGTSFVAGSSSVPDSDAHRLVRRSIDGVTWETVDDFQLEAGLSTYASSIVAGPDGAVYVAGQAASSMGARWLVRGSADGGDTWATVDDFQLSPGALCIPGDVAIDDAGVAYAAGRCNDADLVSHGVVRRRGANGTWSTIDAFVVGAIAPSGSANGLSARGPLLVAANSFDNGAQHWLVRKSDDGTRWSTIDDHVMAEGGVSASAIHDDGEGTLVAVGMLTAKLPHMLTRRSGDDGATWQTIDDFTYEAGIYGGRLASNAHGDLFVTGIGLDADGVNHWVVRRMACE